MSKRRSRAANRAPARSAGRPAERAAGNPAGRTGSGSAASRPALPTDTRARIGLLVVAIVLVSVAVIGADFVIGAISNQNAGSSPTSTPVASSSPVAGSSETAGVAASPTQFGVVVQGNGGHWTNVSPDQLAQMLQTKNFTLVNVKTPYVGEIAQTDLYIPYNQLTANAAKLPADKGAKILVYCLTGTTSKIAAQTLVTMGYTNVWNLDGGMTAWTASGRALVNLNR